MLISQILRVKKEIETINTLGLKVYLFCWDRDSELPEFSEGKLLKIVRIKVKTKTQVGLAQIKNLYRFYHQLLKKLKEEKISFDFIYVHDFLMLPIGAYLKFIKKIPLIYDAHEIYHIMDWEKYNNFIRSLMFGAERFLIKYADHFIVVNQIRKDFYKKYINRNILILGNWFNKYIGDEVNLRDKFNISENDIVFGYFGELNRKVRCLDLMIDTVLEIPNAHLIIGGSGHDTEFLENLSQREKRIHYLGWMSDVRKIYNNVNYTFYFIDSQKKYAPYSSPNNIYLSISHSIPFITNVPGEPEFLISKYKVGYFINNNDAISNKVELDLKSKVYIDMVQNIQNIQSNYLWSASNDTYSRIFNLKELNHKFIKLTSHK